MAEERLETELSFKDYVGILKRRWFLFFLIAAPILAGAVVLAFRLPTIYESLGVLLVEQSEVREDIVRTTVPNLPNEHVRRITEQVLIDSNLEAIIERHSPYSNLGLDRSLRELRRNVVTAPEDPEMLPSLIAANANVIAFRVGFRHPTPDTAQAVAEELVQLYLTENQRSRRELASETLAFLRGEVEWLEQQLAEREEVLAEFKREHAGRLPEQEDMNMQLLDRTERELEAMNGEIRDLRQRASLLETELSQLSPYATVVDENGNAVLTPTERLRVLQAQYVRDLASYSDDHPDIVRLRHEIDALSAQTGLPGLDRSMLQSTLAARVRELEAARERGWTDEHPDVIRLEAAVSNLREALASAPSGGSSNQPSAAPNNPIYLQRQVELRATQTDLDAAIARRDALRQRLTQLEERVTQTPEVEREYQSLRRGYDQLLAQYSEMLNKQQEAAIAVNLETENRGERFSVLRSPDRPSRPAQPNRIAILLLGLALAFTGGAVAVAGAETMDSTVRGPRDVYSLLEIPPLVMVPFIDNEKDQRARRWKRAAVAASVMVWIGVMAFVVMTPAGQ